ncbi:MAG TPA: acyltransferase [Holophagaceae bacterium]|nr:acyltransferase [Holophagaceae bacterium]
MAESCAPIEAVSPARNPGIDLLRGLSIVLVVLHHVGLRIPLKQGVLAAFLPKWFLNALIYNGYEAVFIFFVISGFLIASNSISRWGSLAGLRVRSFYARRAARILPCLVALVAVLSLLHALGAKDYVIARAQQSLPRAALSAIGLHLNWYEGQVGYLPGSWDVLWSLSIEEVFYLGFPLVCLGLRRRGVLLAFLALLALSLPATRAALAGNEIWQEKAYLPGMAGIATGVLGALLADRVRLPERWIQRVCGVMGGAGLVGVLCFEGHIWRLLGNGTMLLLTASALSLVLACHWRAAQGGPWRIPGTGWLASFGRLSYEIYLTHMFVVLFVVQRFRAQGGGLRWGILWYVPALLLSWLLGWLVARYVSLPAEQWLRRQLSGGAAPVTAAVAEGGPA